jgi:transcriptional regulator CtsR
VILVSGIALISSIALAANYIIESRETTNRAYAVQARASAYSCASIAVLRLKKNNGYTGNENISVDKVSCSIGATVVNGNARTLYAQATVNGYTSRIKVDFTGINSSQFYLNSWTEIPPT